MLFITIQLYYFLHHQFSLINYAHIHYLAHWCGGSNFFTIPPLPSWFFLPCWRQHQSDIPESAEQRKLYKIYRSYKIIYSVKCEIQEILKVICLICLMFIEFMFVIIYFIQWPFLYIKYLSSNIMFDFFSTLNKYRGVLSNTYCYGLPNTSKKWPTCMYLPINIQLSTVPV